MYSVTVEESSAPERICLIFVFRKVLELQKITFEHNQLTCSISVIFHQDVKHSCTLCTVSH